MAYREYGKGKLKSSKPWVREGTQQVTMHHPPQPRIWGKMQENVSAGPPGKQRPRRKRRIQALSPGDGGGPGCPAHPPTRRWTASARPHPL